MANGDKAAAQGFTVVASTDDIRLGYDAINRVADFGAYTDGTVTFPGSATSQGGDFTTQVRREGGMAVVLINVKSGSGFSTGNQLFTLPTGFRPKAAFVQTAVIYNAAGNGFAGATAHLQFNLDGTVAIVWMSVSSIPSSGFISASATFPAA